MTTTGVELKAVRLELELQDHVKLRIEAAKRGVSMALLVRKMVEEFLKRTEAEEIARQAAPPRRKPGRPPKDKGGAK